MQISPDFAPLPALVGGALIGLAASSLLFTHGRVAGISGVFGRFIHRVNDGRSARAWFLLGLVSASIVVALVRPASFARPPRGLLALAIAGVLVGLGTRLANGCTSGHGVCGLSRFSARSLVAVLTFMLTAMVTVLLARKLGGAS